jgi:ADP-ribose pyrophosphatase YjhB (NUDIX family)
VGAVVIHEGLVLLVRRGHEPMKGQWSLPGGALEVGETLLQGVRREVREETGLEVAPVALIEIVDRISRDAEGRVQFHYVLMDYLCRMTGGELCCATDAVDVRWARRDELDEVADFTVAVIEKGFSLHARASGSSDIDDPASPVGNWLVRR